MLYSIIQYITEGPSCEMRNAKRWVSGSSGLCGAFAIPQVKIFRSGITRRVFGISPGHNVTTESSKEQGNHAQEPDLKTIVKT